MYNTRIDRNLQIDANYSIAQSPNQTYSNRYCHSIRSLQINCSIVNFHGREKQILEDLLSCHSWTLRILKWLKQRSQMRVATTFCRFRTKTHGERGYHHMTAGDRHLIRTSRCPARRNINRTGQNTHANALVPGAFETVEIEGAKATACEHPEQCLLYHIANAHVNLRCQQSILVTKEKAMPSVSGNDLSGADIT